MTNTQINSCFIAFLDECGDHSLEKIDRDFPLFVLSAIVVERAAYVEKILPIVAESRGKNEDAQLKASFYQLVNCYGELPNLPITFRRKHDNIAGIQIADLCAYPAARKILNPNKMNHAFDVIKPHIYAFNNW